MCLFAIRRNVVGIALFFQAERENEPVLLAKIILKEPLIDPLNLTRNPKIEFILPLVLI
jgi:hypothetical protein